MATINQLNIGGTLYNIAPFIDAIYPIGAIYLSISSTSPATLFGGTWERIQDTFLLAAGSTYVAGDTGGNASHSHTTNTGTTGGTAITVAQMPSHNHTTTFYNDDFSNGGDGETNYSKKQASAGLTYDVAYLSGAWTKATSSVGSGEAHTHSQSSVGTNSVSNMPPYLAVYVWKRVA